MTMRIAVLAVAFLLMIAIIPGSRERRVRRAISAARQALMRGAVRSICPSHCEIVDEDGFATPLCLDETTQIAGSIAPGDTVDVMARFNGASFVAVSIVKTS
jgi:Flp pilus assembly protein CpaB